MGAVKVAPETSWSELEEHLGNLLVSHFAEMSSGMKTKKSPRGGGGGAEQESPPEGTVPFSLGLSFNSVKFYSLGQQAVTIVYFQLLMTKE